MNDKLTLEYLASQIDAIAADVSFLRATVERIFPGHDIRHREDFYKPRTFQSDK